MTPRMSQMEPQSPGLGHRPPDSHPLAPSPPSHPDLYRQSPYPDPYAQPPLTPRPQPPESCCTLPPRSLPSDPFSRVPASPQSQSSSQSPLTPRPLSNEAFCQSPVTPRFQSPDPYSRPPSRPQSRDPFTPLHKPPRPQISEASFKQVPVTSHNVQAGGGFPVAPPSGEPHAKGSQQPPFARSPGASVFPGSQPQMRFTFPPNEPLKGSPSHGLNSHFAPSKPQSTNYPSPGFHQASSPLGSGSATAEPYSLPPLRPPSVLPQQQPPPPPQQDSSLSYLPRAGMVPPADKKEDGASGPLNREQLPELPAGQEGSLSNISQTELEKQRQRQRLRELLIRQQIQRNNLRQEKESAAAAASSSQATWGSEASGQAFEQLSRGMAPYQAQDKGSLSGTPGGNKLPAAGTVQASYSQDERLARPTPAATPSTMDINGRPSAGPTQPFYPRSVFQGPSPQQQMWQQQQQAASVRLPIPSRFSQAPAHELNRPALGSLATRMPGPGEQLPTSPATLGAQFIELRHNAQKGAGGGAIGPAFPQQGPQARPRFFLPSDDGSSQAMRACVMPVQAPIMGSPGLQAQKTPVSVPPSPQGAEMSNSHRPHAKPVPQLPLPPSSLEMHHLPPRAGPKEVPAQPAVTDTASAPGKSHLGLVAGEVPVEPDLDDDFDTHKDLEDDDDDLANLSLDPDVAKGDDDLGNLDNLETNDPHLDDLLNGDEFDLLAYTDPELDTGDKKDIFNEHLRLVESANEKAEREALLKREPSAVPCLKGPSATGKPGEQESPPARDAPKAKEGPTIPCPTTVAPPAFRAQGSTSEKKIAAVPDAIKLEEGCLKASPCQFDTSERPPIKSEGAEKMTAALGLSMKAGQTLLSTGARTPGVRLSLGHFPTNNGVSDKVPYPGSGHPPLPTSNNAILEKFDLGGGSLGLANAQPPQADELCKIEASELPLLIEDLLEHEKKELQKKQQMSSQLPGGSQHLQPHTMLAHATTPSAQPHDGLVGPQLQLGMVARPQGMVGAQLMQQQRLVGAQQNPALTPHMGLAQNQTHVLAPQPQALTQKPMPGLQQQQQQQQQAMGLKPPQLGMQQPQQLANSFFPDTDLDKFAAEDIIDPIAKAKMVALKGIKKVMAQGSIGVAPGMNRQQVSLLAQRLSGTPALTEMQNHVPAGGGGQERSSDPAQARPNPPTFAQGVINEADQRQYEEWLFHTQQLLQMQLKVLEEQIGVHRKSRKALCAKQRTAKKAGREFPEADAEKLKLVTEQQSKIQKQLDQVRKQQKEHTNLMAEYRNKQQQHQQQSSAVLALSPSQSPHLMAKLPNQLLSSHGIQQGAPVTGLRLPQAPGSSGGSSSSSSSVSMAVQQSLPFMAQQHQGQGAMAVPGASNSFFPGNRLLQERQLQQQRLQLAQKLQQQSMMGQVSMQQQQQSMMGQVSIQQQQQSSVGQASLISQPQPPPTPQPGQPLLPKQQGLLGNQSGILVQQLSPQQQQGMLGHSMLQHQGPMGHQTPQRQVVLAPHQQRALGSQQQLAQQAQGMMGHRLLLSQQQRTLLSQQQQQSSLAQHQALLGQGQSAQSGFLGQAQATQQGMLGQGQPGILGQGQATQQGMLGQGQPGVLGQAQVTQSAFLAQGQPGTLAQGQATQTGILSSGLSTKSLQQFVQHGTLSQSLHLSQGVQPSTPHQGLAGKEQQGAAEAPAVPPQEGTEGSGQPHRSKMGSQDLGGQLQAGTQEQPGMANLGTEQHGEQQKQPPELGLQQSTLTSLQLRMQQQQNSLLHQPLQSHPPVVGTLRPEPSEQQHLDATQGPHLLAQQTEQAQSIMVQQQRIVGQGLEQPSKSLAGQQRLQSPVGQPKAPGPMAPHQQSMMVSQQQQSMMVQHPSPQQQQSMMVQHPSPQQQQSMMVQHPSPQQQQQSMMVQHQLPQQQQPQSMMVQQPSPQQQQPNMMVQHPQQQQSMMVQHQMPQQQQLQSMMVQQKQQQGMMVQHSLPQQQQQQGMLVQQQQGMLVQHPSSQQQQQQGMLVQHASPHTQSLLSSPMIRAQLQSVISKNPQLRHLTPQQQQQLQAILVQRHQQSLLQQSQALRQAGAFPGQAQALAERGQSAPQHPTLPGSAIRQPPPSTGFQQAFTAVPQSQLAVGTSQQQGVPRFPTPSAASVPSVQQHPSPQEPKRPSPPLQTKSSEERLMPTQNSLQPTTPKPAPDPAPPGQSIEGTPSPWTAEGPSKDSVNGQVVPSPPAGGSAPQLCMPPHISIKQEPREEVSQCALGSGMQAVKREANGDPIPSVVTTPAPTSSLLLAGARSEAGHLLLQKLLRAKNVALASQRTAEVNGHVDAKLAGTEGRLQAVPTAREDSSASKKPPVPKAKRAQKGNERLANSRKKLRKEEGVKASEALMKQLKQELSLLPLMEPTITANFNLFAPFGSSPINGKSQLKGSFGSAALDSVPDYYSQLLTKVRLMPTLPPSMLQGSSEHAQSQ
uniref:Uncharacterized protein n=1 Tax=Sphenodon punctatus TaxID=8508 RepID=A0A8D0H7K8_SPHPU